jgi:acyl-[acyl-carrier-protein] desaturase
MAFYRDVVKLHLDKDPDYLRPLAEVMVRFEMPWTGSVLNDFEQRPAYLATAGVFRLSEYLDESCSPSVLWGLDTASRRTRRLRIGALPSSGRYRAAA